MHLMNGQARLIYGPSTSNLVSPVTHILGYGVQEDTSDGDMTLHCCPDAGQISSVGGRAFL